MLGVEYTFLLARTIDQLKQATADALGIALAGKMLIQYNDAKYKLEQRSDVKSKMEYTSNIADLKHAIERARSLNGMEDDVEDGLKRLKTLHIQEMSNARSST